MERFCIYLRVVDWKGLKDKRNVNRFIRSQISEDRWNLCVKNSINGFFYSYSWYLDAVTDLPDWKWEGLVLLDSLGDYKAVMPVPLRRKYGFWVVHQPLYCQFLGLLGSAPTIDLIDAFAKALLKNYRYSSILHITLPGVDNHFLHKPFITSQCHTHWLDLSPDYQVIHKQYSSDTRRHLRQAQVAQWDIRASKDPSPLLALFKQHHAQQIPGGVGSWAYTVFENVFSVLKRQNLVTLLYTSQNDQIEAGAAFVICDNRIVYLFNAASERGRNNHARTLLIDQIIREHAGRDFILDFESPEKQSVAAFYQKFGADPSPYWTVKWNRLPLAMRWGLNLWHFVRRINPANRH